MLTLYDFLNTQSIKHKLFTIFYLFALVGPWQVLPNNMSYVVRQAFDLAARTHQPVVGYLIQQPWMYYPSVTANPTTYLWRFDVPYLSEQAWSSNPLYRSKPWDLKPCWTWTICYHRFSLEKANTVNVDVLTGNTLQTHCCFDNDMLNLTTCLCCFAWLSWLLASRFITIPSSLNHPCP